MRQTLFLFIVSIILPASCISAEQDLVPRFFEQITTRNGLVSNTVAHIVKDAKGFLWICTNNGIQRYDGLSFQKFSINRADSASLPGSNYSFGFVLDTFRILFFEFSGTIASYDYRTGTLTNFSRSAGIDSINAISAFRDSRNSIWIATTDGLLKFDSTGQFLRHVQIVSSLPQERSDNIVNSIREDAYGKLWLAMYGKGIFLFDPVAERFSAPMKRSLYNIQIHDLIFSSDKRTVWAASGGKGILKIDPKTFHITYVSHSLPQSLSSLQSVPSIHLYRDSILWIGTVNGLIEYSLADRRAELHQNNSENASTISNNTIVCIAGFDDGLLWFGTQKGLNKLSVRPPRFSTITRDPSRKNPLPTNSINSLWMDDQGNTWYNSTKGIAIRSRGNSGMFHYPLSALHDVSVVDIHLDADRNLWIGTWGEGLFRTRVPKEFSPGDRLVFDHLASSEQTDPMHSNFTRSIVADQDGNILISTWGGGISIVPNDQRNARSPQFRSIRKDTISGLCSDYIGVICEDSAGYFWIATGNGLQRWDRKNNRFTTFRVDTVNKENKLNNPTYIVRGVGNSLWVGTWFGIVNIQFSTDGRPILRKQIVDPRFFAYQLIVDNENNLWFGTSQSLLHQFDPHKSELRTYDLSHEMNGYEFSFGDAFKDNSGKLYFTGSDGVLTFDPVQFHTQGIVPRVYLTSIAVEGLPFQPSVDVSELHRIDLPYDQNDLTINFAALHFERPDGIRYEYILEGASGGWISIVNRTAVSFANLSPGEYRFRVRATNDDRSWTVEAHLLSINISPPFWETFLFRSAVVLGMFFTVFLLVRRRFAALKLEQQRQQQFSKLLIDSQESERKRIASELHDGIGQNMLIISNMLQMLLAAKRKTRDDITAAMELTKETVREIRMISSNLHPHQLERLGLKRALQSMVETAAKATTIQFSIAVQDGVNLRDAQEEIHVYRIVQEIVNNIVKHSGATSADIAITAVNSHIHITARDNGKGFDFRDGTSEGLGMTSLKERTRVLNGTIQIRSSAGTGTDITVTIPLNG
ncbi:MAG: histidine kinase [Bacteroidetes bacterium]|nr:histidine kinase [Bacteroidota bacterium]